MVAVRWGLTAGGYCGADVSLSSRVWVAVSFTGLASQGAFAVAALGFLIFVSAIALKAQHDRDIDSGAVSAHGDGASLAAP